MTEAGGRCHGPRVTAEVPTIPTAGPDCAIRGSPLSSFPAADSRFIGRHGLAGHCRVTLLLLANGRRGRAGADARTPTARSRFQARPAAVRRRGGHQPVRGREKGSFRSPRAIPPVARVAITPQCLGARTVQVLGRLVAAGAHLGRVGGPERSGQAGGHLVLRRKSLSEGQAGILAGVRMNPPIQYAAVLPQVREVSLLGTADLAFWKDRLAKEELVPAETNGQAQVLVIAADSKFMGVPFREVSFSVLVSPPTGRVLPGGAFLVRAFNSCRFFAFCERVWFSTPYDHGEVRVSAAAPVSIRLTHRRQELFRAEMSPREPARVGDGGWHGPVYLPARKNGPGPLFFARLQGHTRT